MHRDKILNVISQYELPLSRGTLSVVDFLRIHYRDYISSLDTAIESWNNECLGKELYQHIKVKMPILKKMCAKTIEIIGLYNTGKLLQAQNLFTKYMVIMEQFLQYSVRGFPKAFENYYRIRPSTSKSLTRKEIFHIPFNEREKIQSYRYSIPGYPCVYLSSMESLCWFECGMPNSFFISEFRYSEEFDSYKILDLAKSVDDIIWIISRDYNKPETKGYVANMCIGIIFLYILKAACSIIANDKKSKFIEEYIFPQLLLLWIRDTEKYQGIAYRTSNPYKSAPNEKTTTAHNLVFPSTKIRKNGKYCSELRSIFYVTKPKKVVVSDFFTPQKKQVSKIKEFRDELTMEIESNNVRTDFLTAILNYCDIFLQIYDSMIHENYGNAEITYEMLKSLHYFAPALLASNENFAILEKNNPNFSQNEIELLTSEVKNNFDNNVLPVVKAFFDFAHDLAAYAGIDQKTAKQI